MAEVRAAPPAYGAPVVRRPGHGRPERGRVRGAVRRRPGQGVPAAGRRLDPLRLGPGGEQLAGPVDPPGRLHAVGAQAADPSRDCHRRRAGRTGVPELPAGGPGRPRHAGGHRPLPRDGAQLAHQRVLPRDHAVRLGAGVRVPGHSGRASDRPTALPGPADRQGLPGDIPGARARQGGDAGARVDADGALPAVRPGALGRDRGRPERDRRGDGQRGRAPPGGLQLRAAGALPAATDRRPQPGRRPVDPVQGVRRLAAGRLRRVVARRCEPRAEHRRAEAVAG